MTDHSISPAMETVIEEIVGDDTITDDRYVALAALLGAIAKDWDNPNAPTTLDLPLFRQVTEYLGYEMPVEPVAPNAPMRAANYSNVNAHRQGFDLDEQSTVNGIEVRFRVHHDTSYAMQSWAKAEAFSHDSLSWNVIATVQYQQWADDTKREDGATCGLWDAYNELVARVVNLVG